jgi:hypothetical protein
VLWRALPEHNPTKLDSAQDSKFTESYDFSKLNYILCHFNYYCKIISPKMEIPVSQTGYNDTLTLEIGFTQFHHTKLKICIKVSKEANSTTLFIIYSTVIQKS